MLSVNSSAVATEITIVIDTCLINTVTTKSDPQRRDLYTDVGLFQTLARECTCLLICCTDYVKLNLVLEQQDVRPKYGKMEVF